MRVIAGYQLPGPLGLHTFSPEPRLHLPPAIPAQRPCPCLSPAQWPPLSGSLGKSPNRIRQLRYVWRPRAGGGKPVGGWYEGCPWHCPGLPGTTLGLLTPDLAGAPGEGVPGEALRNEQAEVWR